MEEKVGIKELKEAMVGINELAMFLAMRMKDGVGVDDAMAVWTKLNSDADFKDKMVAAYDGIAGVPAEIKDIDLAEGLELAMLQIKYIPELIESLKKGA